MSASRIAAHARVERSSSVASAHARRGRLGGVVEVSSHAIDLHRRRRRAIRGRCLPTNLTAKTIWLHTRWRIFLGQAQALHRLRGRRTRRQHRRSSREQIAREIEGVLTVGRLGGAAVVPMKRRSRARPVRSSRSLRPRARGSCAALRGGFNVSTRGCGGMCVCHWPRPG